MNARRRRPSLPGPVPPRLPRFDRFTTGNGVAVVLAPMHDLPIVDVRWLAPAGAALEPIDRAGTAALTADLIDQGAGDYTALELAAAFERLGAHFAATPEWDATALALHVLAPRLAAALRLLAAIVDRPHLDAAEFERKRQERLDALLQDEEDPAALANAAFLAAAYPAGHRYGLPLAGSPATVRELARDDLTRFHAGRYGRDGAVLIVVGGIERPALERIVEDAFGEPPPAAEPAPTPVLPATGGASVVALVDRPGAPQSELRIGHAGPPRATPDYFPLTVLNTILGGAFTSRLNRQLREAKGYTYGARSRFAFRRGPGPFTIATAVDTAVTADAIADAVRELHALRESRVSDDELERARNFLTLGLPGRLETGAAIADRIAEIVTYGLDDDYFDRYTERVGAVGADDVLRAAREYLDPDGLVIALAGDRARIAGDIAACGFGPIIAAGPHADRSRGTRVARTPAPSANAEPS